MMLARFRLQQMWISSLNCLCHITRNDQVVMSRKCIPVYIQRVSLFLLFSFWFTTLCDLSQAQGYLSKNKVKNVTVEPFCSEKHEIKLNVSWQYSEEFSWSNEVHITVEDYCDSETDITPLFNSSITNLVVPVRQYEIKSGCRYRITVSTDQNLNDASHLDVFVDDENCICKDDPLQANLIAVQKSNNIIQASWNIGREWLMRHNVTRYIVKITYFYDTNASVFSNNESITNNNIEYNQETNVNVTIENAKQRKPPEAKLVLIDANDCNYYKNSIVKPVSANIYPEVPWNYTILVLLCIGSAMILSMLFIWKSHCLKKLFSLHRQMYNQPETRRIYRRVNNDELRFRYELKSIQTISQNNPDGEKENAEEMARSKADKYEICYGRLKMGAEIGGGAFGQVFLATVFGVKSIPDHSIVAVKKLKKTAAPEELDEFLLEISMLKKIGDHPNIVRLLGYCTVKQPYCMIMEYVPCGDLLQYLRILRQHYEQKGRAFLFNTTLEQDNEKSSECSYITPETPCNRLPSVTETEYTILSSLSAPRTPIELRSSSSGILEYVLDPRELQNFALQIAQGMSYLENKQIVHRDLAARNVLITENKTLKISDFGLSRSGIYVNSKHKKVPLRWLSVEAIRDNLYTSKSDVWAYGIVLWEIGTLGGFPYPTISDRDILSYLLNGKRLEKPENCTDEFYAIMLQCWAHDKDRRPSFEQLVNYLEAVPKTRKIYVDFCQLNPLYIFPPTQQQTIAQNHVTDNNDYSLKTDL